MVLLAVVAFRVFPQRNVTVLNDGRAYNVSATFNAETSALSAADVSLSPGDRVLYASGGRHASLAVQRARTVTVKIDGQTLELHTQATTVGGVLAEAGLELHGGDQIYLEGQLTNPRGPLLASASYASREAPSATLSDPATATIEVTVVRARPVTVVMDSLPVEVSTAATTVDGLLQELGMTVREGDLVQPGLQAPVTAGMTIRLAKARTVNVTLNGVEQSLYTQAQTVGDVLKLLGAEPQPDDVLSLSRETPVTNGMSLLVGTTAVSDVVTTEPVQAPTANSTDATMPEGTTRIVNGTPGVRTNHWTVTTKNGQEVSRVLASSTVTTQPIATQQITGTKPGPSSKPTINTAGYSGSYTRVLHVRATWYSPATSGAGRSASDPNYGRTASGAFVVHGICAVDPSVIAMGTHFYVPGYGDCVAGDTGGAIIGNVIDLGFPDSAGNPGWGSQMVDIYIIDG
ncbi:MAG: ubiquitin-like domain-containing protein [Tepidiformaceae bacterium]